MNNSYSKYINIWLLSLATIILIMIAVGGLTRLTGSGLSMVDWDPIMGIVPPLSQADWDFLFSQYQLFPEYKIKNFGMTLKEFKFIFWWEYGHRVLGRFIGILFLGPFIFFFLKKCFSKKDLYSYTFLLFLGGTQGLIGWWMVKSGLDLNPYVSHFRLAVHLLIAQIILSFIAFLFLKRLTLQGYEKISSSHSLLFLIFSCSIFITVTYGAFMAGLDAGQSYNTWPKMGETFFPEGLFFAEEKFMGIFDNSIFIHFFHRSLAYLCIAIILIISILHFKKIKYVVQKIHFISIFSLVIIQVVIGIYVVLSNVQISLGSIHQIVGSLLFALTFSYFLLLNRRKI